MLVKHLRVTALEDEVPFLLINAITKELFALAPVLDEAVPPIFQKRLH